MGKGSRDCGHHTTLELGTPLDAADVMLTTKPDTKLNFIKEPGYYNDHVEVRRTDDGWELLIGSAKAERACEELGLPNSISAGIFSSFDAVRGVLQEMVAIEPDMDLPLRSLYRSQDGWYQFFAQADGDYKWLVGIGLKHPLISIVPWDNATVNAPTRIAGPRLLEAHFDNVAMEATEYKHLFDYQRPAYADSL